MEEKSQDKYREPIKGEPESLKEELLMGEATLAPTEKEVLALEKQSAEKKATFEKRKEIEKKETTKEEGKIEEVLEKEVSSAPAPSAPPSVQVQEQVQQLKNLDRQNQIKTLCDLALQKGLDFAVEVARNLDNAYVLDEFHDTLVDELYKKLVEKGELKKL
jgi:hypothetical protein